MFCSKCGARLDGDEKFCSHCGAKVYITEENLSDGQPDTHTETVLPGQSESGSATPGEPVSSGQSANVPDGRDADAPTPESPVKKGSPKLIGLAAAAIGVIAVIALIFSKGGSSSSSAADARKECNFNNLAVFAYDDSNLYFISPYDGTGLETSVYSTSYKGTDKKLISDNKHIKRIRIVGNSILYLEFNDDNYVIGSMNKDGSEQKGIKTLDYSTDTNVSKFDMSKDTLFYNYNGTLYACDLKGGNEKVLAENVSDFILDGNMIYLSSKGILSSYNIKNAKTTELYKTEASNLALDGGVLYFRNDRGLYCAPANGDGKVTYIVKDTSITQFLIDGDTIYYKREMSTEDILEVAKKMAKTKDELMDYGLMMMSVGELYRIPKDGGAMEKLTTDPMFIYSVYSAPPGLYYRLSAFSPNIGELGIE